MSNKSFDLNASRVVGAAINKVAELLPYNSAVIFQLRPVQQPGIGTMAVDAGSRVHYDPEVVNKYGIEFAPTLVCHEHLHPLLGHQQRKDSSEARGERMRYNSVAQYVTRAMSPMAPLATSWDSFWNVIGDMENNAIVEEIGLPWPNDWKPVLARGANLPSGKVAEFYLDAILTRAEKLRDDEQQREQEEGDDTNEREDEAGDSPKSGKQEADDSNEKGSGEVGEMDRAPETEDGEEGGSSEVDEDHEEDGDAGNRDGDDHGDREEGGAEEGASEAGDDSEADTGTGGDATNDDRTGAVGAGRCGGCCGHHEKWEDIKGDDVPEPATKEDLEIARQQVAQAVAEWSSSSGRGTAPGATLLAWAQSQLAPAKVDWRRVLAKNLRSAVASAKAAVDFKFGPLSRRRERLIASGVADAPAMPVLRGPQPRVGVVVDTSGSMGSGTGSRSDFAFVELFGILKQLNTPFFGIAVDSRIAEAREIRKVTDLASLAKGGGGTDMRVGIQRAAELKPTPDVIVVLTDGETPWPSVEQMPRKSRLVVAVVSESSGAFDHLPEYIKRSAVFIDMKNGTGR